MTTIEEFSGAFDEEPGYLDFARLGPIARAAIEEQGAQIELLRRARFGSLQALPAQDARVREAAASVTGFAPEQIAFQTSTTAGLMQVIFGLEGGLALGAGEFPSVRIAVARAAQSTGRLVPIWLQEQYGQLTPGIIRDQLTSTTGAVLVSLVDYRTGAVTDIEGVREVIGDRLLIVDAVQGLGVVDAPLTAADVVVAGGQKWLRAGQGTGLLALSDTAAERLDPVLSGFNSLEFDHADDSLLAPAGAAAFQLHTPNPLAEARLAAVLEQLDEVGMPAVHAAVAERAERLIALADEFGVPVVSPRAPAERAGIVVLEPGEDRVSALTASLHNQGISATVRGGRVRLAAHASTGDDTFAMLHDALRKYTAALSVAGA